MFVENMIEKEISGLIRIKIKENGKIDFFINKRKVV